MVLVEVIQLALVLYAVWVLVAMEIVLVVVVMVDVEVVDLMDREVRLVRNHRWAQQQQRQLMPNQQPVQWWKRWTLGLRWWQVDVQARLKMRMTLVDRAPR